MASTQQQIEDAFAPPTPLSQEELEQIEGFAGEVFGGAREANYDETQILCNHIRTLAKEFRRLSRN